MRILLGVTVTMLFAGAMSAQSMTTVSATGYLTDTLCGKTGATAQHIEHAKRSVASGKAKYAIYDERTRQLYILGGPSVEGPTSNAQIEAYLGQRVTITGTLTPAAERRAGDKAVQTRAGEQSSGEWPVTSGEPKSEVHRHTPRAGRPLDTSTPVAGVLAISSIESAPSRR